jgi:hypothetical protein
MEFSFSLVLIQEVDVSIKNANECQLLLRKM